MVYGGLHVGQANGIVVTCSMAGYVTRLGCGTLVLVTRVTRLSCRSDMISERMYKKKGGVFLIIYCVYQKGIFPGLGTKLSSTSHVISHELQVCGTQVCPIEQRPEKRQQGEIQHHFPLSGSHSQVFGL